jgi:hypothetical protein
MKLEPATLQILKNFSSINTNIMFKEGNKLATISPTKTIMARAVINQEFPKKFAIYDLPRFLGTISLFNDAVIDFNDNYLEIKEGSNKFKYSYTDPSLIITPPEKEIKLPSVDVTFTLTETAFKKTMRALSVAGLPEIAFTGDGEKIYVQAVDTRGATNDVYSVEVGETNKQFRMVFRAENIKLMDGDYVVSISSQGLSHFKGTNVEYFIAIESNSTYTD